MFKNITRCNPFVCITHKTIVSGYIIKTFNSLRECVLPSNKRGCRLAGGGLPTNVLGKNRKVNLTVGFCLDCRQFLKIKPHFKLNILYNVYHGTKCSFKINLWSSSSCYRSGFTLNLSY